MIYPVLTYSRDLGDFSQDLTALHERGLKAIRLIYKGKPEAEFNLRIREIQEKIRAGNLDIDILIDLPGNKPMVGNLGNGLDVKQGNEYHLVNQQAHSSLTIIPTTVFFSHQSFPNLAIGDVISIADDELNLLVKAVGETAVLCEALNSFHLTSNRSLSVKNKPFAFMANSEKDVLFVKNLKDTHGNVKLLVSFAHKADDILKLRALQPEMEIIPKIEAVLDNTTLMEIMDHCRTIMLGRGDLSTVSHPNEIFMFQKRLIDMCITHNKKLIIGTGLLASIGDGRSLTISEIVDYGYLRNVGIKAFLIAGSNARNSPMETLTFMQEFES